MIDRPTLVLVMRHAEKPGPGGGPHLAPAGAARAAKLATYIPDTFGKPEAIFAAAVSPESARPVETVTPLADSLGLTVETPFADAAFEAFAAMLLTPTYAGKSIVVCWHHGHIPGLMRALGAASGSYPDPWDRDVFNLILNTTFSGDATSVRQVLEPF